jgi:hypothetical protein
MCLDCAKCLDNLISLGFRQSGAACNNWNARWVHSRFCQDAERFLGDKRFLIHVIEIYLVRLV